MRTNNSTTLFNSWSNFSQQEVEFFSTADRKIRPHNYIYNKNNNGESTDYDNF